MAEVALVAEWRKLLRHFRHFRHMSFYEYSRVIVFCEKKSSAEDCAESEVIKILISSIISVQSVTDCQDLTSLCFKALFLVCAI